MTNFYFVLRARCSLRNGWRQIWCAHRQPWRDYFSQTLTRAHHKLSSNNGRRGKLFFALFALRVEEQHRRPFVNRKTTHASVQGIAGRGFRCHIRCSGCPLLHVPCAVFALLIFDCANRLSGQQRQICAGLFCRLLYESRFDVGNTNWTHQYSPTEKNFNKEFSTLCYGRRASLVNVCGHSNPRSAIYLPHRPRKILLEQAFSASSISAISKLRLGMI
jgi:hypothetical protein